jgi:hypothetical protein
LAAWALRSALRNAEYKKKQLILVLAESGLELVGGFGTQNAHSLL